MRRKNLLIYTTGLIVCYAAGYYAIVSPQPLGFISGVGPWPKEAHYRVGDGLSALVFRPAVLLEKKLWPSRWSLTYEEIDSMHPRFK